MIFLLVKYVNKRIGLVIFLLVKYPSKKDRFGDIPVGKVRQ